MLLRHTVNHTCRPVNKDSVESKLLVDELKFRLHSLTCQLDYERLGILAITSYQSVLKYASARWERPHVQRLQQDNTQTVEKIHEKPS